MKRLKELETIRHGWRIATQDSEDRPRLVQTAENTLNWRAEQPVPPAAPNQGVFLLRTLLSAAALSLVACTAMAQSAAPVTTKSGLVYQSLKEGKRRLARRHRHGEGALPRHLPRRQGVRQLLQARRSRPSSRSTASSRAGPKACR